MVGLEGCSVKHLAGLFSNMGIKVLELMTASGLVGTKCGASQLCPKTTRTNTTGFTCFTLLENCLLKPGQDFILERCYESFDLCFQIFGNVTEMFSDKL
jgi:hypothetical protein